MCLTDDKTQLAKRMFNRAAWYGLSGTEWLTSLTFEQMGRAYNGIGPAWFPEVLRDALDALNPDLTPVAFIHDNRWTYGDGSRQWFDDSNREFRENGCRMARAKYGWWNPARYVLTYRAATFANLCRKYGWNAYQEGLKRSRKGGSAA